MVKDFEKTFSPTEDHMECNTEVDDPHQFLQIRATPLFEVFSVTINSNYNEIFSDGRPCEVYGTIQVKDVDGNSLFIFSREENDPEMVSLGHRLTLTDQHCGNVSLSSFMDVVVNLVDKAREVEIASGTFPLSYLTIGDLDKIICRRVLGKCGFATVCCTMFRDAAIAIVEVSCIMEDDYGPVSHVHGSLDARYGNNYTSLITESLYDEKNDGRKEDPSIKLFKRLKHQPLEVNSETPICLSRSMVTVPVYSSMIVDVAVWLGDAQHALSGALEFRASDYQSYVYQNVSGENCRVQVMVIWTNAYMLRREPTDRQSQQNLLGFASHLKWGSDQKESILDWVPPLLEVYSIRVISDNLEICSGVSGTVYATDQYGEEFYMLATKKNCTVKTDDSGTIKAACMQWPSQSRIFKGNAFEMCLDLTDNSGRSVSRGFLVYSFGNFERWLRRPICSVVKGEHGYAAVHYTIFPNGVHGKVKISVCGDSGLKDKFYVFGKVVTYHGCYDRSRTWYERDYYQTVLFETPQEQPLELSSGCEIPLSKSVFCVPRDTCLVIESQLWVASELPARDFVPIWGVAEVKCVKQGQFDGVVRQTSPWTDFRSKHFGKGLGLYHVKVLMESSKGGEFVGIVREAVVKDHSRKSRRKARVESQLKQSFNS